MFKKVLLLCFMVLMVSCARQTSDQITQQSAGGTPIQPTIPSAYSALWQNYGSNAENTNVVNGKLPAQSASLSEAATEAGFSVFSSPVIFQDSSTNAQSVVALWAKSDQLKVVRYTIGSSTLIPDPGFTAIKLTPYRATNAHQAHQIALSIENNQPFIFVGHDGGVSKYNALTGALVKTVRTYGSVFRLLVSGTSLYIQSSSHLVKLNAVSMDVNLTKALAGSNIPTRQLPLVISNGFLYVVDGNNVIKVNTDSFNKAANETASGSVAGLMAYNSGTIHTVLYSEVSSVNYGYNAGKGVNSRTVTQTNFKLFGGNFESDFNTYVIERRATNELGGTNNNIGDHSFTAFALTDSKLYLPGFSLELISNPNESLQSGVVTVDRSSPNKIASFYGTNPQEVFSVDVGIVLSNHYVSRFLIVDSNTGQAMSVLNVNELLFQTKDTWGNTYTQVSSVPKISNESGDTNAFALIVKHSDKNKLDAYNSRIMLGNSSGHTGLDALTFPNSTAIQAVSVGNQAVVLAGSDRKLYLLQ